MLSSSSIMLICGLTIFLCVDVKSIRRLIVRRPRTRWNAEQYCIDYFNGYGHLATIGSEGENFAVSADWCYPDDDPCWIGLSRPDAAITDASGPWQWTDGIPYQYTNWRSGEPNNANDNEHCVVIQPHFQSDGDGGKWLDVPCDNEYRFVCEYGMSSYI